MKIGIKGSRLSLGACLGMLALSFLGCETQSTSKSVATGAATTAPGKKAEPADNSYCYVCHVNYQEESLAQKHVIAGVGCETCHGQSNKHSADEDNLTAPDHMYAEARVAPFCLTCHTSDKVRKSSNHSSVFAANGSVQRCTECHGEHRLNHRTRRWDKDTGKLVWKEGGPTMDKTR